MKSIGRFNHKSYKAFADKYTVTGDGRVYGPKGELKYFRMESGGRFVRMFKDGRSVSLTVAKIVMLTFRPERYRKDRIVMHLDGNVLNDSLDNLRFGTRREQSLIHVSKPENWKRISRLGKKYGPKNGKAIAHLGIMNLMTWKEFNGRTGHSEKTADKIRDLYMNGMPVSKIAEKLKISRSSIYNHI
jgi:hypothetical protein